MIRTVIVEDDAMVASINEKYLKTLPELSAVALFGKGADALEYVADNPVDLMLLDVYLPDMDGVELLHQLRERGCHASAIMITAANDVSHFERALHLGVVDYLIKPFSYKRFESAVKRYLSHRELMQRDEAFTQEEIDYVISSRVSVAPEGNRLKKGILPQTLEMVRTCLRSHPGEYLTSDDIAKEIKMSKVTARRYLNYLIDCNEVVYRINYLTGGRPSKEYAWILM